MMARDRKPKTKEEMNSLCWRCANDCKQWAFTTIITCKNFKKKPKQLEIKISKKKFVIK